MTAAFSGIKACVFDAYGTLFDVHAPMARMSEQLGDKAAQISKLWRQKQLEYTWLRSLMGEHADFWQITNDALDYVLAAFGIADQVLHEKLLDLYLALAAYPDAKPCLEALSRRGMPAAILSNGTPGMLEAAVRSAGLRDLVGEIISVEEVGCSSLTRGSMDGRSRGSVSASPGRSCSFPPIPGTPRVLRTSAFRSPASTVSDRGMKIFRGGRTS